MPYKGVATLTHVAPDSQRHQKTKENGQGRLTEKLDYGFPGILYIYNINITIIIRMLRFLPHFCHVVVML
jgi:hypothetical protein